MRTAFKIFRILILLAIFIAVAFYAKTQKLKSRSWSEPLQVIIYPMNPSQSEVIESYINQLDDSSFIEIDQFFENEAEQYSLDIQQPIQTELGQTLQNYPPASPSPHSHFLSIIWWGIKFRYWSYKNTPDEHSNHHRIRVFLHYHQVEKGKRLKHSLGMDKGLLAIVHAFAADKQQQQNNIVIAHELLHTVGASDKYNSNNQPVFPDGYAEPDNEPLYPQTLAEIMSGNIPISSEQSKMADSLQQCIIGEKTATEINWLKPLNN